MKQACANTSHNHKMLYCQLAFDRNNHLDSRQAPRSAAKALAARLRTGPPTGSGPEQGRRGIKTQFTPHSTGEHRNTGKMESSIHERKKNGAKNLRATRKNE